MSIVPILPGIKEDFIT